MRAALARLLRRLAEMIEPKPGLTSERFEENEIL